MKAHVLVLANVSAIFSIASRRIGIMARGSARGTDVKSRLAFTRPRCLAAYLELASVDFATVEAQPVCGGEETFTAISSNITHNPFGLGMKQMTAMPVCVDVKPPP